MHRAIKLLSLLRGVHHPQQPNPHPPENYLEETNNIESSCFLWRKTFYFPPKSSKQIIQTHSLVGNELSGGEFNYSNTVPKKKKKKPVLDFWDLDKLSETLQPKLNRGRTTVSIWFVMRQIEWITVKKYTHSNFFPVNFSSLLTSWNRNVSVTFCRSRCPKWIHNYFPWW